MTTATATTARVETGSFLGRCNVCKTTVLVADRFAKHSCGGWITGGKPIKARLTNHKCGAKCTSATGPNCDCTCAGKMHGSDHA